MATPGLPAMMARQLVAKLAQGSPQGGPPMGPPQGAPPTQAGDQVASQLSELQGADPEAILKMLTQIKSIIVPIYVRSAFTIPDVSRNIAQMQKYCDNAITAAQKAMATEQTVQQNPIANQTAIPNPDDGGQGLQQFASGGGA